MVDGWPSLGGHVRRAINYYRLLLFLKQVILTKPVYLMW